MTRYEAWCRPHGRPDLPTTTGFLVDAIDHRAAWQQAMQLCFRGGRVETTDGDELSIGPVQWTVRKIKLHEGSAADEDAADPAEDWPRPMPELACPSAREAALARLYKGRQYDSFQIRPSRTLLNCCVRGRPVNVAA